MTTRSLLVDVIECRGSPYDVGRQLADAYRRTRGAQAATPQGDLRIAQFDMADARATLEAHAPNLLLDDLRDAGALVAWGRALGE